MKKIPVGVLGATGLVGQYYVSLLERHPWFELVHVAASTQSAGKEYRAAVMGRWQMECGVNPAVSEQVVADVIDIPAARDRCRMVFSCFDLPRKEDVRRLETAYAAAGLAVVSNSSAHRGSSDVPMVIPEINHEHLAMILVQQMHYGWDKGFIVAKPNCSIQSYITPIYALLRAGYDVKKIMVTTMQAVSGAGYPGVASLDIIDNVVPYIANEEEKTEREPLKILGSIEAESFEPLEGLVISAHCNRVPVLDGHMACVNVLFGKNKPTQEEAIYLWQTFTSVPQELKLPSAPKRPILYRREVDRPQTRLDRDSGDGMAVVVGRLRPCNIFDYKFVGLSHNVIRGAAGGGLLNAELLVALGYLK